jgi:hypothetical protein
MGAASSLSSERGEIGYAWRLAIWNARLAWIALFGRDAIDSG